MTLGLTSCVLLVVVGSTAGGTKVFFTCEVRRLEMLVKHEAELRLSAKKTSEALRLQAVATSEAANQTSDAEMFRVLTASGNQKNGKSVVDGVQK